MDLKSNVRRLRLERRMQTHIAATVNIDGWRLPTVIENVSSEGMHISGTYPATSGDKITIEVSERCILAGMVTWRSEAGIGLRVLDKKRLLDLVKLMEENNETVCADKNNRVGALNLHCVGASPVMTELRKTIERAARTRAPVFISGETGTGKEICSQMIHALSSMASGRMVNVNCAALPGELFESEIFGYRKGAFTGASYDRCGAAQQAHNGTLFLDEFCELSLHQQAKLLRFAQNGEYNRLGDEQASFSSARIVCASHRDPILEVKNGKLREDLFYRVHVVSVRMPPLRDRGEDIIELAEYYLKKYQTDGTAEATGFTSSAKEWMLRYDWPGNIRQLQNVIRNSLVFCSDRDIDQPDIAKSAGSSITRSNFDCLRQSDAITVQTSERLDSIMALAIQSAIEKCNGSIPKAAKLLAVSPSTIYRHLKSRNCN